MLIKIDDIAFNAEAAAQKPEVEVKKIADSIQECGGLIQPICVQRLNETSYRLTAGLTRLLATKSLGQTEIDATVSDQLDPILAETMTIHENLKRQNLEWWQEVKLVESLHPQLSTANLPFLEYDFKGVSTRLCHEAELTAIVQLPPVEG